MLAGLGAMFPDSGVKGIKGLRQKMRLGEERKERKGRGDLETTE